MKITLQRGPDDGVAIIGALQAGALQLYTLEPSLFRPDYPAIPVGTYQIELLPSARFKELTPHLVAVPDRSLIEIHPGNNAGNTEGCILVGDNRQPAEDWIDSSRDAFQKLMAVLETEAENLSIEILECPCA